MKNFTIKDLERFSNIKAHTIRTWEQRYFLFQPKRDKSNFRYYTLDEVKKALHIALLTRNGFKVSQLSSLTLDEIESKANELRSEDDQHQLAIIDLLIHIYAMNAEAFEMALNKCQLSWASDIVFREIVFPFLQKIELLWQGHRLDEEHFVVTVLRKKIIVATEHIKKNEFKSRTVLLFLPDQTQLDLALLYAFYLLKTKGVNVVYMGDDISFSNLKTYIGLNRPDFLFTYLPQKNNFQFTEISSHLNDVLPHSKLIVTTHPENTGLTEYSNVLHMPYDEAIDFLTV